MRQMPALWAQDSPLFEGVELHVQLTSTPLKLFSRSRANAQVSAFDAALPGVLPRVNRDVVALGVVASRVLGCRVTTERASCWDRKHYAYADLPHGYQVTQERSPLATGGGVRGVCENEDEVVRIRRVQLEMDTGKTTTVTMTMDDDAVEGSEAGEGEGGGGGTALVDLRRAGCALLEIVSEPDMRSGHEAAAFVSRVRQLMRTSGVSNADMQHGQLRADVNVSVSGRCQDGSEEDVHSERCEIKNLNSLDRIVRAVSFEEERQRELLSRGVDVPRETRGFDPKSGRTYTLRSKEKLLEYRFLPEPDLPSLFVTDAEVEAIVEKHGLEARMEQLPERVTARLLATYGGSGREAISESQAKLLSSDAKLLSLFEAIMRKLNDDEAKQIVGARRVAQWLTGPFLGAWRAASTGSSAAADMDTFPLHVHVEQAELLRRISTGSVSERAAKQDILPVLVEQQQERDDMSTMNDAERRRRRPMDIDALIVQFGVGIEGVKRTQGEDSGQENLRAMCAAILAKHPREVESFLSGTSSTTAFFITTRKHTHI